jgi:hypothetical protein
VGWLVAVGLLASPAYAVTYAQRTLPISYGIPSSAALNSVGDVFVATEPAKFRLSGHRCR